MRRIMSKFSVLCLNGGGIRGVLQVGALSEFSKHVGTEYLHTVFVDGVYGISVGSIICALIAFKFSMSEIEEHSKDLKFDELLDPPRLDHILNIHSRQGFDTGERLHDFLKNIFQKKGLELDSLCISDASTPLYIIASDITNTKRVIFNESVKVWDAIRASISLPIVFVPHMLNNRMFMDGAILCKNIIKVVPKRDRHKVIAFLCINGTSDVSSASKLMSKVIHAPSIAETRWCKQKYPQNVCLLTETSTDMIDFKADTLHLLECGKSSYRLFLTES